jgi:hypothetical protein
MLLMGAEPKANTRGLPTLPAFASPLNGIVEIAESGQFRLKEFIHKALRVPSERTLVPGDGARIAETRFADWLRCCTAQQQPAPSVKGA